MLRTRFTDRVGCSVPVQQAPMGGVATAPDLAAAVADAGGQGMVAAVVLPAPALSEILDEVARRTQGAFGVNFLMPFLDPDTRTELVELAAAKAALVDFFYGDPDPSLVKTVHAGGALASW